MNGMLLNVTVQIESDKLQGYAELAEDAGLTFSELVNECLEEFYGDYQDIKQSRLERESD